MEDNKQLAQHVDGTVQSVGQEVTNLHSELLATRRRLAELGANGYTWIENNRQHRKHPLTPATDTDTRLFNAAVDRTTNNHLKIN
ncbi:kazrin-like [Neoarius graeffei]|uniref:kazrin-like n=1 Tax=Neoarius graeffei TaxID=443677 RepID=UPI00298CAF8C|nr:kazrin-like [Neoarius graeffei]